MRIISGKFRKKSIVPPKNFKARPTTDMAKESLFNIIDNMIDITQIKALDLFSGTGSITYELASRGCNNITCVELNYNHYSFIKKTIAELQIDKQVRVVKSNVFVFAKHIKEQFNLIFADPPYNLDEINNIPDVVFNNNLLANDGILIVEHSEITDFSSHKFYLHTKKYGSVNFSFFNKTQIERFPQSI